MDLVKAWNAFKAMLGLSGADATLTDEQKAQLAGMPTEVAAELMANHGKPDAAIQQQLTAFQARTEQLEAALAETKAAERATILMDFKRSKKLLPAAEENAMTLLAAGGEIEKAFLAFLESNGVVAALATSEQEDDAAASTMPGEEAAAALDAKRDDQTLHNMAAARAKKDNIGYSQALALVAKENPALVDAVNSNLVHL